MAVGHVIAKVIQCDVEGCALRDWVQIVGFTYNQLMPCMNCGTAVPVKVVNVGSGQTLGVPAVNAEK